MDINNLRETVHHNQVPKSYLIRDNLETSPTKCYVVGVESSDTFMRGMKIKSEPQDFDCKMKKRKRVNFVDLDKETVETCSGVKQEFPNFQHEVDEYDLEEPFISRKSKLSKNIKSGDEDLRQLNRVLPAPVDVKVEVPETTNLHLLKADVPYPTKEPQPCSLSEVSYEYMENFETKLDMGVSGCEVLQVDSSQMIREPEYCSLNEVSYEFREIFESKFDEGVSSWETVGVHSPEMIKEPQYCSLNEVSREYMENSETEFDVGVCSWETTGVHSPQIKQESQFCSVNEVSDEYMEDFETKFDVGVSTWEILQVHSPETISNEYSDLSGYMKEDYIIDPLPYNVSSERMSPTKDYSCDACDSCQNESPKREMPWQPSCYSLIQTPETTIASGMETGVSFCPIKCGVSNGVSYESTEDVPKFGPRFSGCGTLKVDSPEMISYQSSDLQEFGKESYTVYPLAYVVPSESVSPTKDHCSDLHDSFKGNSSEHKMASQISSYGRAEVPEMDSDNCFQCSKNNNEDSACSVESRSTHDWSSNIRNIALSPSSDNGLSQMKHKHRAERLHSSRKVISPTSRERLCQAMGLPRLDENACHHCRGELYFGKQTHHSTLSAQGVDQFWRDGVTIEPKSTTNKAKQDKKECPIKGIPKVTDPSLCRSQSIIAFTQRQMQDFESLTMKLTTELKSMKDLFKRKFHSKSEASAATCAKENAEVSVAIENATRAEGIAIRWLSMLARDSKRFCKIMRLNEDKTGAPERVIKKERKVSFADEAGGKLWQEKGF